MCSSKSLSADDKAVLQIHIRTRDLWLWFAMLGTTLMIYLVDLQTLLHSSKSMVSVLTTIPSPPNATSSMIQQKIARDRIEVVKRFYHKIDHTQESCDNVRGFVEHQWRGDGFGHIIHMAVRGVIAAASHDYKILFAGRLRYASKRANGSGDGPWTNVFRDNLNRCGWRNKDMVDRRKYWTVKYYDYYKYNEAVKKPQLFLTLPENIGELGDPSSVHGLVNAGVFHNRYFDMGPVWIRCFTTSYIYRLIHDSIMDKVHTHPLYQKMIGAGNKGDFDIRVKKRFLGIHIRRTGTDNRYALKNYMKYANEYRKKVPYGIDTIYLVTDNEEIVAECQRAQATKEYGNWTFVWKDKVKRSLFMSTRHSLINVLLDIEILSYADALVGSMVSNYFRLATELNFARHWVHNYENEQEELQRFYSLDVPWHQNP